MVFQLGTTIIELLNTQLHSMIFLLKLSPSFAVVLRVRSKVIAKFARERKIISLKSWVWKQIWCSMLPSVWRNDFKKHQVLSKNFAKLDNGKPSWTKYFHIIDYDHYWASPPRDNEIFSSFALILGTINDLVVVITPCKMERELCDNTHYLF